MLSSNHSFRKFNILSKKRSKVDVKPIPRHVSLDDLAFLVKRLSVQVDDLVEENQKKANEPIPISIAPPSFPEVKEVREESISKYLDPTHHPLEAPSHTIVDPWASYVPQNYGALLKRLEDVEMLQKCPNECCALTGTVSSADGVPWPQPIEPFTCSSSSDKSMNEMLDIQYAHWCTLLRCLPIMDAVTSAHVKTVGLYAMREILKCKASNKRERDCHANCTSPNSTSTRLRESMSCLNFDKPIHDFVMPVSETKIAVEETGPMPPPKENETTTTPTPSGYPSPHHSRFQKWVQYKKISRKSNTDTSTTPMAQSQTLRKIGSWFF